jgi:hypothetical protein
MSLLPRFGHTNATIFISQFTDGDILARAVRDGQAVYVDKPMYFSDARAPDAMDHHCRQVEAAIEPAREKTRMLLRRVEICQVFPISASILPFPRNPSFYPQKPRTNVKAPPLRFSTNTSIEFRSCTDISDVTYFPEKSGTAALR